MVISLIEPLIYIEIKISFLKSYQFLSARQTLKSAFGEKHAPGIVWASSDWFISRAASTDQHDPERELYRGLYVV